MKARANRIGMRIPITLRTSKINFLKVLSAREKAWLITGVSKRSIPIRERRCLDLNSFWFILFDQFFYSALDNSRYAGSAK